MATYSVFLPGEFHTQRSLAGYSPWGCKEFNTTEQLNTHTLIRWELILEKTICCSLIPFPKIFNESQKILKMAER